MSRTLFSSLLVGLLTLIACSRQSPDPVSTAPSEQTMPTPAALPATVPATTTEIPAESSLAIKRGVMTLDAKQATFQPCGEQAALWVIDQTDGTLRETFKNEAAPIQLYIEAHAERAAVPAEIAAARAYAGVLVLEEVLYATPPAESAGCAEPAPNYVVTARGNEPFWSVEVREEQMIWRQPDEPRQIVIDAPQAADAEGAVGYTGRANGHSIELLIDDQICRDSMSGAFFAYAARAVLDGKEFKGCARIGE